MQIFHVPEALLGLRLDKVLCTLIPNLSLRSARRLCENSQVLINAQSKNCAWKVNRICELTVLDTELASCVEAKSEFNQAKKNILLYQDQDYALVYKASQVHSSKIKYAQNCSLEEELPQIIGQTSSEIIMLSRLDYFTSGLVPVALHKKAELEWQKAQNSGLIQKEYLAIVEGCPQNFDKSEADSAQNLILDYAFDTHNRKKTLVFENSQVEKRLTELKFLTLLKPESLALNNIIGQISLARVCIYKGVRHQIRASLAHAGYPLLFDSLYSAQNTSQSNFYLQNYAIKSPFFNFSYFADWTLGFAPK